MFMVWRPAAEPARVGVGVMMRTIVLAAIGVIVGACGIHGPKGNDTGGIIPWSPEAESSALGFAESQCRGYGKTAVISSVRRVYGDYIAYSCRFDGPLRRNGPG